MHVARQHSLLFPEIRVRKHYVPRNPNRHIDARTTDFVSNTVPLSVTTECVAKRIELAQIADTNIEKNKQMLCNWHKNHPCIIHSS